MQRFVRADPDVVVHLLMILVPLVFNALAHHHQFLTNKSG